MEVGLLCVNCILSVQLQLTQTCIVSMLCNISFAVIRGCDFITVCNNVHVYLMYIYHIIYNIIY